MKIEFNSFGFYSIRNFKKIIKKLSIEYRVNYLIPLVTKVQKIVLGLGIVRTINMLSNVNKVIFNKPIKKKTRFQFL